MKFGTVYIRFKRSNSIHLSKLLLILPIGLLLVVISGTIFYANQNTVHNAIAKSDRENAELSKQIAALKGEYETLKATDQVKRNDDLESTMKSIQSTYKASLTLYENLIELPATSKELPSHRKKFALILKNLSERNYSSAAADIKNLSTIIDKEKTDTLATFGGISTATLTTSSTPPGSGYSRQLVEALGGSYLVDIIAGNLSTTRVIVATASNSDCRDNCPALPLATYVSRNSAFAGINGSYFCPADYPRCAGKTNSFDTLAMGENKHYHNSDNNVYSTVPLVVFGNGFVRFIRQSSGWGRDTGVDGVLANQPLLLSDGNVIFGGDGDPKKGSRGNRSFVASKGNTVYIGVVRNATVAESAQVLKAMGMENALNLDSGGSTALWSGGYKAGPGRNIPNAILFVKK